MKKKTYKMKKKASLPARPKKVFVPSYLPIEGVIEGTGRGFAFFVPDDGSGDIFIPASALSGAIHGDRVKVVKVSERRGSGEGEVVKIIKRKFTQIVGVFDGKFVIPDERALEFVRIERGGVFASPGDKVVVNLLPSARKLKGTIVEVLGNAGETEVDIMSVIKSYSLPEKFPKPVSKEARLLPSEVLPEQIRGRRDFRDDLVVTIDGEDSKDFDDAIEVRKTDNGYKLFVHIADVAEYVKEGSALDKEAFERGTSVYFADRVIPMLPEKLSNGICSLNEGEDRLTLTAIINFNNEGEPLSHEIIEGAIRSKARLTYGRVQRLFDGDETEKARLGEIADMLFTAKELALLLNERRMRRGAVEFDIPESAIIVKGDEVVDIQKRERLFSHKLIEEFMLIANETVAEHYFNKKIPFVYRVHEVPPEEKVENLNAFLSCFGYSLPEKPSPSDYSVLMESLDERVRSVIQRASLRSMSKAEYKPQNLGHFGLSAQYYCHFTSPIRRYPDLSIHRIIKSVLRGENANRYAEFVTLSSIKSSECEKIAEEAERKVDDLLKAKFMQDKVGLVYDATVSGVTEWGVFAELDNTVEGLIRVESLGGYGFKYDEGSQTLSNGAITYRLGDKITVKVDAVHFDKVSFSLAQ